MTTSSNSFPNKNEKYKSAFPEQSIIENPRFAEIWVRQKEGSFVDRCVALPELPVDHTVRINMERWGFQLVARIFAKSIRVITYKGFYNTHDSKNNEKTEHGTIVSQIFGEDIEKEDGEAMLLNMFLFKGFYTDAARDQDGNIIMTTEGKAEMVNIGKINSVSFYDVANKEQTDKMLNYRSCCLPMTVIVKDLEKIQILASQKGGTFTVSGAFLYEQKSKMPEHTAVQSQAKAEESVPTSNVPEYSDNNNGVLEPSTALEAQTDDLPF